MIAYYENCTSCNNNCVDYSHITFQCAFVEGYIYPALFMKSNSTAKMYVDFTFSMLNNKTWNLYPHFTGLDTPNPPAN